MAMKKQTNRANLSRHGCLSHAIGTGWQSAAIWRNRIPRHNTNIDLLFLLKPAGSGMDLSSENPREIYRLLRCMNDMRDQLSAEADGVHP